jgi:hypothetical protein
MTGMITLNHAMCLLQRSFKKSIQKNFFIIFLNPLLPFISLSFFLRDPPRPRVPLLTGLIQVFRLKMAISRMLTSFMQGV